MPVLHLTQHDGERHISFPHEHSMREILLTANELTDLLPVWMHPEIHLASRIVLLQDHGLPLKTLRFLH